MQQCWNYLVYSFVDYDPYLVLQNFAFSQGVVVSQSNLVLPHLIGLKYFRKPWLSSCNVQVTMLTVLTNSGFFVLILHPDFQFESVSELFVITYLWLRLLPNLYIICNLPPKHELLNTFIGRLSLLRSNLLSSNSTGWFLYRGTTTLGIMMNDLVYCTTQTPERTLMLVSLTADINIIIIWKRYFSRPWNENIFLI